MTLKQFLAALNVAILTFTGGAQADSAKLVNPNNGHSYQRFDTLKTWNDAKNACAGLGSHLATITSQPENDWIIQSIIFSNISDTYLGATSNSGAWRWITGESFVYTYWGKGEPNYSDKYLTMAHRSGLYTGPMELGWNNDRGTSQYPYLCEWDKSFTPFTATFTATPKSGNPPLTVNFVATVNDPDGSIVSYQWDFDGDGRMDDTTTTGKTAHTYTDLGTFKPNVTIVDNKGTKKKSSSISITVQYGPDLIGIVDSYSFKNETNTIHIDFKVTNAGDIPARQFPVMFNLSNNGTKVLSTFKSLTVDSLAAGESQMLSVDYTFDASIYGQYILILVDPTKNAAEVDETNNGTRIVVQPMATK